MIRWAPLNLPLHRRIETATIFLVTSLIFINLFLYFLIFLNPWTWPLAIPYFIWAIYYDHCEEKGGRRLDWVRKLKLWVHMRNYFPCTLIKEQELDPEKNYIFGYHPHGIIATGMWINFCTEANNVSKLFPGLTIHPLTLIGNLKTPIWRELLLSVGICSVSKESINYILNSGHGQSVILVPGGAREALDAHPGTNGLTLKQRRGFIKMALLNGSTLVPVFSFGENDIFRQVDNSEGTAVRAWQQMFLKYVGFAPCMPYGRGIFNYDFGFLPRRIPIVTIGTLSNLLLVGKPIDVPKVEKLTDELVEEYQEKYIASLYEIYNKYKDKYAPDRSTELEILR